MSRINTRGVRAAAVKPLIRTTTTRPNTRTYEGAPAYTREVKGELFLLGTTCFFKEDTYYEKGDARAARLIELARQVAVEDLPWFTDFVTWLRGNANIRTTAVVIAAEGVQARLEQGLKEVVCSAGKACPDTTAWGHMDQAARPHHYTARRLVSAPLQRADEPGEFLAYWISRFGRPIPIAVDRGLADAVDRLYNEYSLLKYDTDSKSFRFADVIDLIHPKPSTAAKSDLYSYALARRHNRADVEIPETLPMVRKRKEILATPLQARGLYLTNPDRYKDLLDAGFTWEAAAGWLQGPMDSVAWRTLIPGMGYMALLRNLRNFDEAGVPDEVADAIAAKLADPHQVAKSRQLPYRFLSAHLNTDSYRWSAALEKALDLSVANVPAFSGRTLVLIDTSASMQSAVSNKSKMTCVQAGAIFGIALGARGGNVDVYGFGDGVFEHKVKRGTSILRETDRFIKRVGEAGHGTNIYGSLVKTYRAHDRVVIISDMQTAGYVTNSGYGYGWGYSQPSTDFKLPTGANVYCFNTHGYASTIANSKQAGIYELGGLNDSTFALIPNIEAGKNAVWPWEHEAKAAAA